MTDHLAVVLEALSRAGLLLRAPPARPAVDHLTVDSRAVQAGALFLAVPGSMVDGHAFVGEAVRRGARAVAMIGPGAGCLPEPLFARGVTAIGGTWIEDRAGFVAALRSGSPWGRHARKVLWRAPGR